MASRRDAEDHPVETLLTLLTWLAALGAAMIAGVFFAFSTFVMAALGRRPTAEGIAAMQEINVVVVRSGFIAVFFATAAASLALAIVAVLKWNDPRALPWLAGAVLYGLGTFVLTIVRNVPLNDALAAAAPGSSDGATLWARYLVDWTFWNSVRTVCSLAATVAFIVALT
jgi:uncharacterized membrane protein